MEITKEIIVEGNLIEKSVIKLYYKGKFIREYSNEVFIVLGYGLGWKNIKEQKMLWINDCFFTEIKLEESGVLNFCFRNDFNAWDNNNGQDYIINIKELEEPKEIEINETIKLLKETKKEQDNIKILQEPEIKQTEINILKEPKIKQTEINILKEPKIKQNDIKVFDKINKKEKKKKRKKSKNRFNYKNYKRTDFRNIIRIVCLCILVIGIIYIIIYFFQKKDMDKQTKGLLNSVDINKNDLIEDETISFEVTERMLQVRELNAQYPDLKGWIEIEGTNINYPLMQGIDNDFYVKHDYKKEYSKWGSLFLDKAYDWTIPSSNMLIYGHNFSDGVMFSDLLKYSDKTFYEEHPIIKVTTSEEDSEYEIIAVFYSRLYYKSEKNVFRYYFFVNAENELEYNEFVNNAKKASIYDTGKTAVYGDQLLTLSTCEYSQEDGRFAIVARKIK